MTRRPKDDGFTLIELVVTVSLMGIIIVALCNFLLAYLKNYTQTQNRLSDSHDIQIATAYVSQDVANTGLRSTSSPYGPVQSVWTADTGFPGSYCGRGSGTAVLLLQWDSWSLTSSAGGNTGSNSVQSVAYANEGGALHRIACTTGTTVASDATLVHALQGATVQCSSACGGATPPATVTLKLSISAGPGDTAAPSGTVDLTGQRRQST